MATYRNFEPQGAMRRQIEAFFEDPSFQVAEPRLAATVMLVDGDGRDERLRVFMMQRASTMEFVPDAVVFPGGGVSPDDYRLPAGWAGPSPAEWADALGRDERDACAVVVAAARELFEECGVLLATRADGAGLCERDLSDFRSARKELAEHRLSFAEFLDSRGMHLRSDMLSVKSNIVTPEFSKRRYDTFFFAASLPEGQAPDGETSESVRSAWADPKSVLSDADEGKLKLLPPTRFNIDIIVEAASVGRLMERGAVRATMRPGPYVNDEGVLMVGFRDER